MCVDRRKRRVLCRKAPPFCLLLPGRQGFILHSVTRLLRPWVISTIRESATLCTLTASGLSSSARFYGNFSNSYYQCRRASLGKTHHLPISRPTSQRFGSPDIWPCHPMQARPLPHCHIVGLLFATYMGSASCFLQTPHLLVMPLPCRRSPPVR
jgi:hypothetical protein